MNLLQFYQLSEAERQAEDKKREEDRQKKERIEKVKLWQFTLRQEGLKILNSNRPTKIEIL